ncbi:MAG: sigma-70 family RNA polymerase sigma factor [Planctomycetes bacterium]|nr:sigma-70 family RNA polymerase sigma factor [Planctomycetota bacterium]
MTQSRERFAELMTELRAGSEDAVRELVAEYGPYLLRVVRRRLADELRTKFDSQDFVQSVWKSLFANLDVIDRFDRPGQLAEFLAAMAGNKLVDEYRRRMLRKQHNVQREKPLLMEQKGDKPYYRSREPSPSTVASAREEWARLAPYEQRLLELWAANETLDAISRELNVSERTVRRVLERLAKERRSV